MNINRNTAKAVELLKNHTAIADDQKGILLCKDCVLMERYTGKSYMYELFNYITGEKITIGRRKEQADKSYLINAIPIITKQKIYNTAIPTGKYLIRYIFTFVFAQYGYVVRQEQVDLAVQMYSAMKRKEVLMSDVAVGFGKTHAYLVAAIVYNIETKRDPKPIIVSTSSKELQKAIMDDYIPSIAKMLLENGIIDEDIAAILRKGKSNYVCPKRLHEFLVSVDMKKITPMQMQSLKRLRTRNIIDLDNAPDVEVYYKRRISVRAQECRGCGYPSCSYRTFMHRAVQNGFGIQVCNHNYLTMDAKNKALKRKPLLPEYKAMIIDEAHKLNQAAVQTYSVRLDFHELRNFVLKCSPKVMNSKRLKRLFQHCKLIASCCERFPRSLAAQLEDSYKCTFQMNTNLISELKSIRTMLVSIQESLPNRLSVYKKSVDIHISNVETFIESDLITYIERVGNSNVLVGVPTEVESLIKNDLLGKNCSVVMTSGTLAVDKDFEYIKGLLGLTQVTRKMSYVVKHSPFNYMDNSLIYLSEKTAYPNYENELYIKTLAEEIHRLIQASCGHALVLFTSYEPMQKVHQVLKQRSYPFPLLAQKKNSNQSIVAFKKSENAVLLGCGSMWEGMNFAGDKLSHLIVTKLPFLIPDPITEHKRAQLGNYEAYRQQVLLPQMLLKLKQGHGRAIRTETDTAVISILDSRVNTRYKAPVQNALPKCRYTSDIKDVRQFFKDKKTSDYFGRNEHESAQLN